MSIETAALRAVMPAEDAIVFIIDDDSDLRQVIATSVRAAQLSTKTFSSAREFLAAFDDRQPGCLVVDERMPGMTGRQLQQELTARGSVIPIIFISGESEIATAASAMRAGAVDFLPKPFCYRHLMERVHEALALSRRRRLLCERRRETQARVAKLTVREREIMQKLAQGETTKAIARSLGISQKTVINHQTKVLEKMWVENTAQLVAAIRHLDASSDDA